VDPLRETAVPDGWLTRVQWTLLAVIISCAIGLFARERIARRGVGPHAANTSWNPFSPLPNGAKWSAIALATGLVLASTTSAAWLTPLERIVALTCGLVALAVSTSRARMVPVASLAVFMPLQDPTSREAAASLSPDATPVGINAITTSFMGGSYLDQWFTGDDCNYLNARNYSQRHRYGAVGVSYETGHLTPRGSGGLMRYAVFTGTQRSLAGTTYVTGGFGANATPPNDDSTTILPHSNQLLGGSLLATASGREMGVELGLAFGRLVLNHHPRSVLPISGLRIGPTSGLSAEASVGTELPAPLPEGAARFGLGFSDTTHRWSAHAGLAGKGPYAALRIPMSGVDVEPTFTASHAGSADFGLTVKRRF
jgi:hypothetical protein